MAKGVPAIVLAAGASSRLGQPKALVKWNGESLIARSTRLLSESGCSPVFVVTRPELQVDVMLECSGAIVVVNTSPEDGRTGSLQIGLISLISELGRTPKRVIVSPVDRCGWNLDTVETLMGCYENTSPTPSGHPLMLCDVDNILSLPKDASLRDSIKISKITAPGVHMNIDTPADLEGLH